MTRQSINLNVNGLTVQALQHGAGKPVKILCVHGWLDNAHSFLPLWPHLPDADIVAIDLPGHGQSAHLGDSALYSFTTQAHSILAVATELGWNSFHLIGHSLGGCLAPFCAVAAPGSINSITLIDAAGPQTETAEELPERLRRSAREYATLERVNSKYYTTIEDAIAARLRANKMNPQSARLIIERQLSTTDQGYRWSFDRKLRVASARYFTEPQLHAVLRAVECPALCILAEQGFIIDHPKTRARLDCLQHLSLQTLPGNHHMHMDSPAPVGAAIKCFLGSLPALQ